VHEEGGFRERITRLFTPPLKAGTWIWAVLLSFVWGAVHAFSPGHGKAIVGTYLVGMRAKYRHALVIGAIVTVTHTLVVIALALAAVLMGDRFSYPNWLQAAGAAVIILLGLNQIRLGLRGLLGRRRPGHGPRPGDVRCEGHSHSHFGLFRHTHAVAASQNAETRLRSRDLVAVGLSGGLVPCPAAIVLLLLALQVEAPHLGLTCLVSFSVGLASVLMLAGLLAVAGLKTILRWAKKGGGESHSHLGSVLPALTGVVLVVLGCCLLLA
jgi:ABC-type nickel/cobalt efflux system permease component RcnA